MDINLDIYRYLNEAERKFQIENKTFGVHGLYKSISEFKGLKGICSIWNNIFLNFVGFVNLKHFSTGTFHENAEHSGSRREAERSIYSRYEKSARLLCRIHKATSRKSSPKVSSINMLVTSNQYNLFFYSLEVVSRHRHPQSQLI